jgi:hypothetical protein
MTKAAHPPIKLFQFPRRFGIPNVSPFCCKLETWLRIARVPELAAAPSLAGAAPVKGMPRAVQVGAGTETVKG